MFGLDDAALLDLMHANAQLYLDAGVTTVRDLGDRRFGSLVLRDRYRSDPASGPELVVSGPPYLMVESTAFTAAPTAA